MWNAMALAFAVVVGAPVVGIWSGHAWAKANGFGTRGVNEAGLPGEPA